MASRLTSSWLTRTTVALAVVAFPAFAAGSAQAAIAGANSVTTSQHPDIRSATLLDAQDAQVCFDKAIDPTSAVFTGAPTDIYLTEYADSVFEDPTAVTADPTNNKCADLAFFGAGSKLDLGQATIATAEAGAVSAAGSGGLGNLTDSITFSGSTTHNGTAGLSVGPDLSGPSAGTSLSSQTLVTSAGTSAGQSLSASNSVTYTFDQAIDPSSITSAASANAFFIADSQGNICYSDGVEQTSATTVVAHFGFTASLGGVGICTSFNGLSENASDARRAGVKAGAVKNIANPALNEVANASASTNLPTFLGTTTLPSLTSASIESNGNTVDYTFDHPLDVGSIAKAQFFLTLSDGQTVGGASATAATSGGSNIVSVTFNMPSGNSLSFGDEYVVRAGVLPEAVKAVGDPTTTDQQAAPVINWNIPGSVAAGGNAGAFARGFTTGPDVYATQFNSSPGVDVITLDLDQRAVAANSDAVAHPTDITLLDAAGSTVGSPMSVNVPTTPIPGTQAVTLQISPAVFALNPVAVQIGGPAVPGYCGFASDLFHSGAALNGCSVPQIVSVNAPSAKLKAAKVTTKRHARKHARKVAKRVH